MEHYECKRQRKDHLQVSTQSQYHPICTFNSIYNRLADLMDQHKEELATLESVDSGAVYTLALKTHVGFSIDTFRYFAGWCDKIQGSTIPINNARPNSNLSFTKREPIG